MPALILSLSGVTHQYLAFSGCLASTPAFQLISTPARYPHLPNDQHLLKSNCSALRPCLPSDKHTHRTLHPRLQNDKSAHSSAPAQHCLHACQMRSAPAQHRAVCHQLKVFQSLELQQRMLVVCPVFGKRCSCRAMKDWMPRRSACEHTPLKTRTQQPGRMSPNSHLLSKKLLRKLRAEARSMAVEAETTKAKKLSALHLLSNSVLSGGDKSKQLSPRHSGTKS